MEEGADGIYMAAPMWRAMMDVLLERYPPTPFVPDTDEVLTDGTVAPSDIIGGEPKIVYYDKKSGQKNLGEKGQEEAAERSRSPHRRWRDDL